MTRIPGTDNSGGGTTGRRWLGFWAGVLSVCLFGGWDDTPPDGGDAGVPPAQREGEDHIAGRLVRVPLPIAGTVDTRVKRTVDQLLSELPPAGPRPVLVFEFWPPADGSGEASQFERALSLARYLASDRLSRVRTVAYIPRTITGHAVLAAIACEEIIMYGDAELGDAGIAETSIDPTVRRGYSEIADRRRTIPAAVALGMLDAKLKVYKVSTPGGANFVLEEELEALKARTTVRSIDTLIPAGEMGRFTGSELRLKHGFVSHLAADHTELAAALKIPVRDLEVDVARGQPWRAIRVDLKGPVNSKSVTWAQRGIEDRLRAGSVNFACVWIDSPGGGPAESVRLANFLSNLDSTQMRTVAQIANEARADAAIIALACDHVVLRDDSIIGGPGAYQMNADEVEDVTRAIREIARSKSRRWSLTAAMIDPELTVHRYTQQGSDVVEYFCDEELAQQSNPQAWVRGDETTVAGEVFRARGPRAAELGLARYVVADFSEFRQLYHLEDDPELLESNWAHDLITALSAPEVAGVLLFVAGFALVAELASPGIGVGGFVSAICFLLFFWSNFLHGTAGWLEVLLFLAGLTFVALEVFVIPGFGIFGLGGGAMMLVSVILASQTFVLPRNEYQLQQVPQSLFVVAAAGAGVFTSLVVLRRYLHRAPILGRVMLRPPEGDALEELSRRESLVDFQHLVGQRGKTTSPLVPAGKARFGEELVDVITEGELIPRGTEIYVMQVSGNHIVVQAVDSA